MQYPCRAQQSGLKQIDGAAPGPACDAESAFYDAMARYGHNSAEAFVAHRIWRELRKQEANRAVRDCGKPTAYPNYS
jgi:hypothetical protein